MVEKTDQQQSENVIKRTWRHFFIGLVLVIHMFTYVGSYLVLQQFAYYAVHKQKFPGQNDTGSFQFSCETNLTSDGYKEQIIVQQETSNWILYASIASGVPAIFANFGFGLYSDRFGRKVFLTIAFIGLFLKTFLCTLAIYFELNLLYFIIFFALEGIVGAQMSPMTISFSLAADITTPGKIRSFAIALIDMALGTGVILGTLSSGYLIQAFGYAVPVGIYAVLLFIDIAIIIIIIPETRHPKEASKTIPLRQNIKDAFRFFYDKQIAKEGKRSVYILCTLIFLLVILSTLGKAHIDTLYELNAPFCWSATEIGVFSMARNAAQFLIGVPVIRLLQLCLSDEYVTLVGLLSNMLGLVQEGLAPNSLVLYLVIITGAGAIIPVPLTRGMMSKITPADKQGALFAGTGAVSALCNVLGAIFANGIYTGTVGIYKGLVYLLMAFCCLIGVVLLIILAEGPAKKLKWIEKEIIIDYELENTKM